MIDDRLHPRDPDFELVQRLEAFAAARLSPSLDASSRMRAKVMREAHRVAASLAPAPASGPADAPAAAGHLRTHARRRGLAPAILAAAFILLALGGTAAAAKPGGPLYPARVWAEAALLPPPGDARAAAQLQRLEERLRETLHAAASGDPAAVAAALAAYHEIVEVAIADGGADAKRMERLQATLGKHVDVLETLLGRVPEQARHGITNAIEKSGRAVERIGGAKPGNGPPVTPPGRPAHGQPPGGTKPEKTAKPDRTPHATPEKPPPSNSGATTP